MNTSMWLRGFWSFIKVDVKMTPTRMRYHLSRLEAWYAHIKYKKIYEEQNVVVILFFAPFVRLTRWRNKRSARALGISLEEFYEQHNKQVSAEIALIKQDTQRKKKESMDTLAKIAPGATIHDYNALEKLPFLSIRFLLLKGGD